MTVHVRTHAAATGGATILSLQGDADQGLLTMLADGIATLASPGELLIVDIAGLTSTSEAHGHALLSRLLGDRGAGRVVLLTTPA